MANGNWQLAVGPWLRSKAPDLMDFVDLIDSMDLMDEFQSTWPRSERSRGRLRSYPYLDYSSRNAFIGSIFEARTAGMMHASAATTTNRSATQTKVAGSDGLTP